MKRVLHVIGGMGRGGAPIFIINNLKNNDNSVVVYDFLCRKDNCEYSDTIQKSGGHFYCVPSFPRHFVKNYFATKDFFKKHASEYSAIHVHANALIYMLPLRLAKRYGIPIRIIHSHNTKAFNPIYGFIHLINRAKIRRLANRFLSCGDMAGKWMFGKNDFEVINNAIDLEKFKYDFETRNRVRNSLNISEETFVIGHIGRFETAKNHPFIIEVFKQILNINTNSLLVLVGTGSQMDAIRKKVFDLKIDRKVLFLGSCENVSELYQAMDVFVLPSFFEGFPFVLVEAQASGLPCYVSDNVSKECAVTDLVEFLSLNNNPAVWAGLIANQFDKKKRSSQYAIELQKKGYSIKDTSKRLAQIYCGK